MRLVLSAATEATLQSLASSASKQAAKPEQPASVSVVLPLDAAAKECLTAAKDALQRLAGVDVSNVLSAIAAALDRVAQGKAAAATSTNEPSWIEQELAGTLRPLLDAARQHYAAIAKSNDVSSLHVELDQDVHRALDRIADPKPERGWLDTASTVLTLLNTAVGIWVAIHGLIKPEGKRWQKLSIAGTLAVGIGASWASELIGALAAQIVTWALFAFIAYLVLSQVSGFLTMPRLGVGQSASRHRQVPRREVRVLTELRDGLVELIRSIHLDNGFWDEQRMKMRPKRIPLLRGTLRCSGADVAVEPDAGGMPFWAIVSDQSLVPFGITIDFLMRGTGKESGRRLQYRLVRFETDAIVMQEIVDNEGGRRAYWPVNATTVRASIESYRKQRKAAREELERKKKHDEILRRAKAVLGRSSPPA
jgi:hypothetical protein